MEAFFRVPFDFMVALTGVSYDREGCVGVVNVHDGESTTNVATLPSTSPREDVVLRVPQHGSVGIGETGPCFVDLYRMDVRHGAREKLLEQYHLNVAFSNLTRVGADELFLRSARVYCCFYDFGFSWRAMALIFCGF